MLRRIALLLILLLLSVSSLFAMEIPMVGVAANLQITPTPQPILLPTGTPGTTLMTVEAAPSEFAVLTDPVELLASYFSAINLQDYARAYGYWEQEPNGATLEQFAAGYAETAHVEAIVLLGTRGGGAAGSVFAEVPTLVIATQTDGSQQTFVGCYIARKSNVVT